LRKEIELSLNEYETLLNKAAVGSVYPGGLLKMLPLVGLGLCLLG